jgi:hydroxymethylglutaryl-CoA lyase
MVSGYEAGVRIFDTSAGGLGGCPFVKGAAGNIATEDAVYLFESMGVATGIDLQKICAVGSLYETLLSRRLPAHMGRVLKTFEGCDI